MGRIKWNLTTVKKLIQQGKRKSQTMSEPALLVLTRELKTVFLVSSRVLKRIGSEILT